jgi:NCS1 family nucleobase:cation symporter-1
MKSLVYAKVVVFFAGTIAMLAWTVSLAGGSSEFLHMPSTVRGTEKSYLILKFFWLGLAACGTFVANAADLQRYARKPNDVLIGQMISFPLSNLLVAILGNVIAASSKSIFGEVRYRSYNPQKLLTVANHQILCAVDLEPSQLLG